MDLSKWAELMEEREKEINRFDFKRFLKDSQKKNGEKGQISFNLENI